MQVVIAGGNGFIGTRLTRELRDHGHSVEWLSYRPGRAPALGLADVRETAFDVTAPSIEWRGRVAAADAVVNLSGHPISSRWNAEVEKLLVSSRIDTTRALADAIAQARSAGSGPSVFVCASGAGYYGDRGDDVLRESDPPGDDFLARLAADWEAATAHAADAGARVVNIRTGLVLGDTGLVPRMALPMKLFVGGPVGSGRQWFPWIHIDDIAGVYRFAVETPTLSGPVNAVAPGYVRMKEFAAALGRAMRRPSWLPVPGFALSIVMGKVARYTLMSQRASADKLLEAGYEFRYAEAERALSAVLGGAPPSRSAA